MIDKKSNWMEIVGITEEDYNKITPMMKQYFEVKRQNLDSILFFRLGDFYEMFFNDALRASKELEITLTGRDCGLSERAPMCGVPHHSADMYISRLVARGIKVAICEQVEDPASAKGIVKREITRVVTPGTVTDSGLLEEKKNNFLLCVYMHNFTFGLAACDVTTGEVKATSVLFGNTVEKVLAEIAKYKPNEICCNRTFLDCKQLADTVKDRYEVYLTELDDNLFAADEATMATQMSKYFISEAIPQEVAYGSPAYSAVCGILFYLEDMQKTISKNITVLSYYSVEEYMALDINARRNLEITESIRDNARRGSLLWVMDKTQTSMGGRTLRKWIEQPLLNVSDINDRLDAVGELCEKFMVRSEIREYLRFVYDIERLMGRIVMEMANARDMISLKKSFQIIPLIKNLSAELVAPLNVALRESLDELTDLAELIEASIIEEPPVSINEGGIIKEGYNEDVDKYRSASVSGKTWIAELEQSERERTGIKNLKIGFNKVFGYFIEVTKSYYDLVPIEYTRKQTLSNCERFITQELKEIEESILGAEDKLIKLEHDIFINIRSKIADEIERIKRTASAIADFDALCSFAEIADRENYCRPTVDDSDEINIINGRHPVVEKSLKDEMFIPNDTFLNLQEDKLAIITGPNMAGKSTFMRQTALIVMLAQAGSFVPADSAHIGVVDKIFTRIGASDDLAGGMSTFMVEMNEVSTILKNATNRSLLILDEIGRGTSTYDGLSIAWSVVEYIMHAGELGARTLFATHYHELTELESRVEGIKNYCFQVKEDGSDIVFLRKIARGGADGSYGIDVAKLAGLPDVIINRAREILAELESADINTSGARRPRQQRVAPKMDGQFDIFTVMAAENGYKDVIESIRKIDLSNITPFEAMQELYNIQQKLKG